MTWGSSGKLLIVLQNNSQIQEIPTFSKMKAGGAGG